MPALEALVNEFERANIQPIGISVDSIHCHANWAAGMGGISYPLLADFHPKGATAAAYGLYLADAGITDRATVIIDADGVVRHVSSVTPSGRRDIAELAQLCREVDQAYKGELTASPHPPGLPGGLILYVKEGCPFCRHVLLTRDNLHLGDRIQVREIGGTAATEALMALTGKSQVPCLVVDGKPMLESKDIASYLVSRAASL